MRVGNRLVTDVVTAMAAGPAGIVSRQFASRRLRRRARRCAPGPRFRSGWTTNLPVTDLPGASHPDDHIDDFIDVMVVDPELQAILAQQIHCVLLAP